ncbi:MAG: hypothetical protein DHS20C18_03210 [Saprospiraceae bacterium]|nr:MAG: hypothetical protein DHS20C18_03210 [Saprospiraceae bacterium]
MNKKTVLLVFLASLGIYALTQVFASRKIDHFQAELINLDTAVVQTVIINTKKDLEEITLSREGQIWIASNGKINVRAVSTEVDKLLSALSLIRSKRIAAKVAEKWSEYEVGQGEGTRLRVYTNAGLVYDFIVGKFGFNQQSQRSISYLRLTGEKEVYAIDGFQALSRGFDAYRNKVLSKLTKGAQVTTFSFLNGDTSFVFSRHPEGWLLNDQETVNSAKVESYLTTLEKISGNVFADDFDETQASEKQINQLQLEGDQLPVPILIRAYLDTTRTNPYVLHSSLNKEAWFSSDSSGVYLSIFKDPVVFREEE